MYSPVTRLLLVLDLLQSRPSLTAAQLAERLEVNTRSVRRYIMMLQDLGIPVEAERGRYGGYRLRPGYKLPPLMWTEGEAIAITLGLRAAQQLGFASTLPHIEPALAKVERVLPQTVREQVQAMQETVILDLAVKQIPPGEHSSHLALLSGAAYNRRRVAVSYQDRFMTYTERLFDCYGLVYRHDRWYVAGYCHLRQEKRVLRMDRIQKISFLDQIFERPVGFDCFDFVLSSFATVPASWLAEILLQATLEQAKEVIPPEMAIVEEGEQGILVRIYSDNLDNLARFIAGIPYPFTVLGPPALIIALQQLAERLLNSAQMINCS